MQDKQAVLHKVKEQLALDFGCNPDAFDKQANTIILTEDKDFFRIATFGKGAVIRADKSIYQWCLDNLLDQESMDILDGSVLFNLEAKLREHGKQLAGSQERYLFFPQDVKLHIPKDYQIKWFEADQIPSLYPDKRFKNALAYKPKDVLAVVALDGDEITAMAGAGNYKKEMWQIGIDTMPAYREKGFAAYLVNLLATEICRRGFIPYYTTWSANLPSTWVALKSGFLPAWIEYYAKDTSS